MNIAIDISPLKNANSVRGVGFYLSHLKDALLQYYPKNIYHFFSQGEDLPRQVDIIHYPYFDPFFLTLPFMNRYKTIVTVHDVTPLLFPQQFPIGLKGKIKWEIQKFLLSRCDAIITDSQTSKNDIEKICHISPNKIHSIYLAAGEQFQPIQKTKSEATRKKYHLPPSFLLYVGDATPNKNLPVLLDIVTDLKIPLVIVGKTLADTTIDTKNLWNKDVVYVQKKVEGNSSIQILGFVSNEDLVGLYNAATAFVMPSLYEGFGLPALEAMASGCPVIASHGGSLKEVVGSAAYIINENSTKDISEAIKKVYSDKKLQQELSEKGIKQAENFSWENTAKETMAVYQSLL